MRWRWPPESWCGLAKAKAAAEADFVERALDARLTFVALVDAMDRERLGEQAIDRLARVQAKRTGPGTPSAPGA